MSFESRTDGEINFLESPPRLKSSRFEKTSLAVSPSYLLSFQVKKTLYTFWILKVTLRDKANSNSGAHNQCDLRGVSSFNFQKLYRTNCAGCRICSMLLPCTGTNTFLLKPITVRKSPLLMRKKITSSPALSRHPSLPATDRRPVRLYSKFKSPLGYFRSSRV